MRKLETVIDLLEATKERHGWSSDSDVARGLGVPQPTVACWRSGIRTPGDEHALKIAEALEISPMLVIAIAAAERAKSVRSKKIWQLVAKEISEQLALGAISTALALAALAGTYTPPTQAQGVESVYYDKYGDTQGMGDGPGRSSRRLFDRVTSGP